MADRVEYILSLKDLFTPRIQQAIRGADALDNRVSSLSSGLGSKLGGAFAVAGVGAFGMEVVRATAKMDGMRNAVNFSSGSLGEGAKSMAHLTAEADRLGLPLEASIGGFKTLSGALMGTGINAGMARNMFSQVSSGVSVMNLSADDANGVFLALGQMMSKGKVSAEELRGQIGERIPGAFGIAARAMGLTTQKMDKMMSDGKIMSKDFLPKFAAEMQKTFGSGVLTAAQSLQANLNRLENKFFLLKTTLGEELRPAINLVVQGLGSMLGLVGTSITWIKNHQTGIKSLATGFGVLAGAVLLYNTYLRISTFLTGASWVAFSLQYVMTYGLSGAYTILTGAVRAFGIALTANPIGLAIAGFAALVAGLMYAWNTFEGFRGTVIGLWNVFKFVFLNIKDLVVDVFMGVNKVMMGALSFDPKIIAEGVNQLKGVGSKLGKEFNDGFNSGVKDFRAEKGLDKKPGSMYDALAGDKGGAADKGKDKSLGSAVGEVAGKRPQNLYITINKLVETFQVNSSTFSEAPAQVRDEISKVLLSAVNDVNAMAGG